MTITLTKEIDIEDLINSYKTIDLPIECKERLEELDSHNGLGEFSEYFINNLSPQELNSPMVYEEFVNRLSEDAKNYIEIQGQLLNTEFRDTEELKLVDVQGDIDDENITYLYFSNNKDVLVMKVVEGNKKIYVNKNIICPPINILTKSDLTSKSFELVKYCYNFWVSSDNGLNSFIEKDIYEDDGYNKEDFENMFSELNQYKTHIPSVEEITFEEDAINIYPKFFESFNLKELI